MVYLANELEGNTKRPCQAIRAVVQRAEADDHP